MQFLSEFKDMFDRYDLIFHEFCRLHKTLFFSLREEKTAFQGQQLVLLVLLKRNGCTQKELAKILNIKPGSLTDGLQRMEKAGLVERKTDDKDLRITRVFSTEKSNEQMEKVKALSKKISGIALEGFSKEEKNEFVGYMERVIQNINNSLDSKDSERERGRCCEKID